MLLQGGPEYGLIDSCADISIIGGSLFKRTTVAKLRKQDFQKVDRTLRTYDQKPFSLDGRIDLFADKRCEPPSTSKWTLTISCFCRRASAGSLGLLRRTVGEVAKVARRRKLLPNLKKRPLPQQVRVSLVQSEHFLPHQSRMVEVKTDSTRIHDGGCVLFEPTSEDGVAVMEPALIPTTDVTPVRVMVSNPIHSGWKKAVKSVRYLVPT